MSFNLSVKVLYKLYKCNIKLYQRSLTCITDLTSLTPFNFLSLKSLYKCSAKIFHENLGQINRWYTLILEETCQEVKINLKR